MTTRGTIQPSQSWADQRRTSGQLTKLAAVAPNVEVTSQPYQYIGGPHQRHGDARGLCAGLRWPAP